MGKALIFGAKRTPIGSFLGKLSSFSAPQLGAEALRALISETKIPKEDIQECLIGQVLQAGSGQAPARQAAIIGGLPTSVPCMTINKVCGSGLKAVMMAADLIELGRVKWVVAGGQESMSQAPFLIEGARNGWRMGAQTIQDAMLKDGLLDPYHQWHMGNAAELCVREYKLSREEQDAFAVESYKRAIQAEERGWFRRERITMTITQKGKTETFVEDEEPKRVVWDKIPQLKPVFEKEGTITAANASKINDGAAMLLVGEESAAKAKGLSPLARILGQAHFAQDPKWFTTAPVGAIRELLKGASLKVTDIDLWEINEAFSAVTLAAMKELSIPHERVNVHGGAVALGHPIGASGARILTTLIYALQQHGKRYGIATLCLGGGEAVALLVEAC